MKHEIQGHVTTELTSKRLKSQILISWIGVFIGVLLFIAEVKAIGFLIALGSIIWNIVTRIRIWWNHG